MFLFPPNHKVIIYLVNPNFMEDNISAYLSSQPIYRKDVNRNPHIVNEIILANYQNKK